MSNNGLGSSALAHDNIYGLAQVRLGMNESEVLKLMNKPYKQKSIEYQGNEYDFWFYVTRPVGLGQSHLVRQNLTPLTFENGRLIGWGFDHYDYVMAETKKKPPEESAPATPSAIKKQEVDEDKGVEKALKSLGKPGNKGSLPKTTPSLKKAFNPSENPPIPQSSVSMSSKPVKSPQKDEKEGEGAESPLDDEDKKMLEDENEQNFDFW